MHQKMKINAGQNGFMVRFPSNMEGKLCFYDYVGGDLTL